MTFSDHHYVTKQKITQRPWLIICVTIQLYWQMWGTYGMTFRGPLLEHLKKSKACSRILALPGYKNLLSFSSFYGYFIGYFIGSIVLTLSHFSCFFWGGGYITREFDRFLNQGNTRIFNNQFCFFRRYLYIIVFKTNKTLVLRKNKKPLQTRSLLLSNLWT